MSLHTLANHLQQAGRGQDKMLVHMTPGEVSGLQSLAMAHGGSLTINPETGLPEAGILGKLLPTVLGFALGPAGFGVMSATQAGLAAGAVGTLATGSLSKGIMAGLGAYGGAQLGWSLMGAGKAVTPIDFGAGAGQNLGTGTYFPTQPSLANAVSKAAPNMTPGTPGSQIFGAPSAVGFGVPTPEAKPFAANLDRAVKPLDVKVSAPDLSTGGGRVSAVAQGLKDITSSGDKLFDFAKENYMPIAAIAASMSGGDDYRMPGEEKGKGMEKYRYVYDRTPVGVPAMSSAERNYFPGARYESTGERYAASGGLMALANGGTVEEMSRLNTIGANTGYPMANQMSPTYASPAERPISENIIRHQGDANVDPYTGEQKFDNGGAVYVGGGYDYRGEEASKNSGDAEKVNFFDPNYYNPRTGTYGYQAGSKAAAPSTELASPEQAADIYERLLGRQPDPAGLKYYAKTNRMTPEAMEKSLRESDEYFYNLTKPFVPEIRYGANGIATIDEAPRYDPTQYGFDPSQTNARNEIKGLYQNQLGRIADPRGEQYWADTIGADNQLSQNDIDRFRFEADKELKGRLAQYETPGVTTGGAAAGTTGGTAGGTAGTAGGMTGGTTGGTTGGITGGITAGGTTGTASTVSKDPNAYKYNYFENKPEENALIKQFQTGANDKARADLTELYLTKLGRLPDEAGFNYYLNTIGKDNFIDKDEEKLFLKNAEGEQGQARGLQSLYDKYLQREGDLPGREYWMGEIGRAGGVTPEIESAFATGAKKEVNMGNAGYSPDMYEPIMGRSYRPEEKAQLEAEAPFRFGADTKGIANNYARDQLLNLYKENLGRTLPDEEGFNYWLGQIGQDNRIDANEKQQFLDRARQMGETVKMAGGGMFNLGSYSDGGRLLKGPGDGVSDSIPAVIGQRQPARLADGEFVIPARIVSELGNGSTDAGARKLYAMMDRVQKARRKTTGKSRVAANTKAEKYLPA